MSARKGCPDCNFHDKPRAIQSSLEEHYTKTGRKMVNPGGYSGQFDKVDWVCGRGHVYPRSWREERTKDLCPVCFDESYKWSRDEVSTELLTTFGFKLVGDFVNTTTDVQLVDVTTGKRYQTTFKELKNGSDPRRKSGDHKTTEQVKDELLAGGITLVGPFTSVKKRMLVRCEVPGHDEWEAKYHSLMRSFKVGTNGCAECSPKSGLELEMHEWLASLGVTIKYNKNSLLLPTRLGIDFFLPEHRIGIEVCGLFPHSDATKTKPERHRTKWSLAFERGIDLIHVFEDDWENHKDEVKKYLSARIGGLDYQPKLPHVFRVPEGWDDLTYPARSLSGKKLLSLSPLNVYYLNQRQKRKDRIARSQNQVTGDLGKVIRVYDCGFGKFD